MSRLFSTESFFTHLLFWKIGAGFVFLIALLFFGDLFCFIFDAMQKKDKKWVRYLYSTLSLLCLFFALRLLNAAYELFIKILNATPP